MCESPTSWLNIFLDVYNNWLVHWKGTTKSKIAQGFLQLEGLFWQKCSPWNGSHGLWACSVRSSAYTRGKKVWFSAHCQLQSTFMHGCQLHAGSTTWVNKFPCSQRGRGKPGSLETLQGPSTGSSSMHLILFGSNFMLLHALLNKYG